MSGINLGGGGGGGRHHSESSGKSGYHNTNVIAKQLIHQVGFTIINITALKSYNCLSLCSAV